MFNLGLVLYDQGDLTRSRSVLEEAMAVRRQQHDKNNTAQVASVLAIVALAQDRLSEAGALISESIALRQELGENIALAESKLIHSAILLERNNASAAEKDAREAAATFNQAAAWGREGEAAVVVARAQLARGDAAGARATLAAANKFLADSKAARLRLRRDVTQARVLYALGRKEEAAAILDRALAESLRPGFLGMALEIRLASMEAGEASTPQLALDAQQAGFLLIARKARQ
jgi:tetratricopeptide (TPR) repeat protein